MTEARTPCRSRTPTPAIETPGTAPGSCQPGTATTIVTHPREKVHPVPMTLEDATENIGMDVLYRAHPAARPEQGIITAVRLPWVFVQYRPDPPNSPKATDPFDLEFQ